MDIYADNILDHFKHPRGQEPLANPSVTHQELNASCGDELTISLEVKDGTITGLSWSGTGCAISQAAMSLLSEELTGMSIAQAEKLEKSHVYELLGVPVGPRRFKCALLGLHALKNALRKEKGLQPQSWIETVGVEN